MVQIDYVIEAIHYLRTIEAVVMVLTMRLMAFLQNLFNITSTAIKRWASTRMIGFVPDMPIVFHAISSAIISLIINEQNKRRLRVVIVVPRHCFVPNGVIVSKIE